METTDKRAFKDALDLAYETVRQPLPSPAVLQVFWAKLERYPLEMVLRAISRHVDVSEFAPTPAGLLKHLPAEADGRPEVNEAWAIALRSRDESETVVWTQECAEAFFAATPVLDMGDEVGARMAFKDAYTRIVETNRACGTPSRWVKSLGHDAARREQVLEEAVRLGLLSLADARTVVPQLAAPAAADTPSAQVQRAKVLEMVSNIPSAADRLAKLRSEELEKQREATEETKRVIARRVDEYRPGAQ
jgi:hypothetical protein